MSVPARRVQRARGLGWDGRTSLYTLPVAIAPPFLYSLGWGSCATSIHNYEYNYTPV